MNARVILAGMQERAQIHMVASIVNAVKDTQVKFVA